jgi:hypothetical protein
LVKTILKQRMLLMDDTTLDLVFPAVSGRDVLCRNDGGDITSDAGLLLVSLADKKLGLTRAMANAIADHRDQSKVTHSIVEMARERIYAICQDYEDANDLDTLRHDPALKTACKRLPKTGEALASQPTISRFENMPAGKDQMQMAVAMAQRVISALPARTSRVIIDADPTEDPCHGQQELELFNGHYGCHCYLPVMIHITGDDGRQRIIGSVLRPGNSGPTKGLYGALRIAIRLLRKQLPYVQIVLRADSAFGVCDVLDFCEDMGIDYILGMKANNVLHDLSAGVQMDAALKYKWEGNGTREYGSILYKAGSWRHARRVVVKAEITQGDLNPRFVVTSLENLSDVETYEFYCGRGEQENRIKEMKLDLSSGRTSCHSFLANQFRLLMHTAACMLMGVLQESLAGTRFAKAQIGTLRTRLLKVGARVVETARKVWFHLPSSFPAQDAWRRMYAALVCD